MIFNRSRVVNVEMRYNDAGKPERVYIVSKGRNYIEYANVSLGELLCNMIEVDLYDMLLCDYVNVNS